MVFGRVLFHFQPLKKVTPDPRDPLRGDAEAAGFHGPVNRDACRENPELWREPRPERA